MLQNIQSLLALAHHSFQGAKEGTLRHEQIVYGKVNKIYPNHTAVVQIGRHSFVAKLETPLTVNAQYWFQVLYDNQTLTLKVLEQFEQPLLDSQNKEEYAAEQLLKKWSLSDDAGRLLRFLLKQNLPIIKKHLLQAAQWIEKTEYTDAALQAIKLIYENNLPFTKETFEAMKSLGNSQPFYKQLIYVRDVLESLPQRTETVQKLLEKLNMLLEGQVKGTAKQWNLSLLAHWLNTKQTDAQQAFSLLQKLGIFPQERTEKDILQTAGKQLFEAEQSSPDSTGVKKQLAEIVARLQTALRLENNEQYERQFRFLLSLLQTEEINETKLIEQYKSLLFDKHLSKSERQLLETIILNDMDDWNGSVGDRLAKEMKQMIQSLGLQYEADLQSAVKAKTMKDASFDELKPLLLKVLQEFSSHSVVKEAVEPVIHRLTAQQLLSQEQGPIQHIFLQLPLRLGEQLTDVTVQWHGKKQENGQIDPNYCRILFYLQLPFLKETIIDVHIQKRVVNISIMTEVTGLEPIIASMQPMLKENFEKLRYKLSAVKVVQPVKQHQRDDSLLRFSAVQLTQGTYSGVDYRI
ncbi:hypothetical protein B0I26_101314 [Anoxybacillus vitaminiphilus]|uniref:Uncharacterized protein n=1 Tax=Paranoxybacillus vitaminiphilus TaxID=581036 RepID=A0A327YQX7_9BACL|nr:hypothetical protein [Anoxybacillus vitaminiphilus]RAK23353.1 hypothetical protein B0I26_101314 [Anoxybacillus vitaminiphilus]